MQNKLTAEKLCSAIQENIESMINLILNQSDKKVGWEWVGSISQDNVTVYMDTDLSRSSSGQHTLDRFRNALNALGYDFTFVSASDCVKIVYPDRQLKLNIKVSEKIMQDASDADYADFCKREEEQLQKSGLIY
tara:strand:- start:2825 stop:3226 length:402 start_codon:yes stop_codon:yes gene_type:complete